jgi:hypothetical protein
MTRRLLLFLLACCGPVIAQTYDVVILHGRVMDPATGLDAIRNVGIRKGKIAAVTADDIKGRETINARGLVVAPGFIDLHSHGQDEENYRYKAHDGVTTALELEVGVWPVKPWYEAREGKSLVNFGASAGFLASTMAVLGDTGTLLPRDKAVEEAPDPAQQREILDHVADGLADGGLGIGIGIAYVPKTTREEIFRVFEIASHWRRPCFVHMRFDGNGEPGVVDAVQEVLADAVSTGAPLHIVHITSMALRQTPLCLRMIDGARAHGLDVTTEMYPYTAGSTSLQSAVFNPGWQQRLGISYDGLQWAATGERLTEETFEKYRKQEGWVIIHSIPEEVVREGMADHDVMFASDGRMVNGTGHPRSAGTFARVLGYYVRETHALTLMDALRRMTLMPAQRLEKMSPAMRTKGRIGAGMDADITVFNPDTIIDKATFEKPAQYSAGIEDVLVGGTVVIRHGDFVDGVNPGRGIVAFR